jgi:NarL family two-component system response regulator LiaR
MKNAIRVLIVDDHEIVRKGIRALLSKERGIETVGEAANGVDAIAQARSLEPDVILMDLVMPKVDGIQATRAITTAQPDARVLVLTSFAADDKVFPAIKAGALGYLLKDSSPTELIQAIRAVHLGQPSLDSAIALKVLQEMAHPAQDAPPNHGLTEREEEVLRLIAHGKSNREIADELTVAEITVSKHVSNILCKLHLASRTQAALFALKEGLVSLDDVPPKASE